MTAPHDPRPTPNIIRRQPSGPLPQPTPDDTRTGIIRRAPTGPIPAAEPSTTYIPRPPAEDAPTGLINRARPVSVPGRSVPVDLSTGRTAMAASAVSIVSGWATAVVATDLITGWWGTDRLFCVAVAFLALLFAVTTVAGVILLLLRRSVGRYLIAFGAVVALLTFGSVFIAGARIPLAVYFIPLLPVASLVLALHPSTRRWCRLR